MKNILLLIIINLVSLQLFSQQEAIYSQFLNHQLIYNPGYTGSAGVPCVNLSHRQQWIGLEGAPSTSTLSYHMPLFGNRVGAGASIINDQVGYTKNMTLNALYSYRIVLKESFLSLGIQGSYRRYSTDEQEAQTLQSDDPLAQKIIDPINVFNVGFGAHFENENFFLGLSVPRMLKKSLDQTHPGLVEDFSGEIPHFYFLGGVILQINKNIKLRPALLTRYVKNTPLNMDMHTSLGLFDKFWIGMTYRWNKEVNRRNIGYVSGQVEYFINPSFKIGAAYDLGLGHLQSYNSGTVEVLISYCFGNGKVPNPRFF